jgi:CheY-like chemotaxis protein
VFEVLPVDDKIAQLIGAGALPDALVAAARPAGMRTLWESGLVRVWQGDTTIDELARVLGDRPDESAAGPAPSATTEPAPSSPAPVAETAAPAPKPKRASTGRSKSKKTKAAEPAPTAEAVAKPAAPPTPDASPASATGRILVADDDRQMRRLIRMILERDGYEVAEAADGLDALDLIEGGQFDLLILDLDMPRLDGVGVLDELRARVVTSSLPVIVLTARTGESEAQVLDLGAHDFLAKPVQPASLQARVRAVLRRTRMS